MHTTCFHKKLDDPMAGDLCPGDICPGNICPSLSSIRIADISWPKFQVMILGPFRFNFDQNTMDQIFLKFFLMKIIIQTKFILWKHYDSRKRVLPFSRIFQFLLIDFFSTIVLRYMELCMLWKMKKTHCNRAHNFFPTPCMKYGGLQGVSYSMFYCHYQGKTQ